MSTVHLFVSENNSKALFPTAPSSKPTSELIPRTRDIDHEHPKEEEEEEEEEEIISPTTSTTAASISVKLDTEENNKEAKDITVKDGGGDDNEDDGYQTPTSPRHRILVDMKYPPPPPKKPSRIRYAKRKERAARARVWVDIDGEINSFVRVELLDETGRRSKKAKEESGTATAF